MSWQRTRWSMALAALVVLAFGVAVAPSTSAQSADMKQQVKNAHQQFLHAVQQNDKDAARALMSDDIVWVNRDGSTSTKEQWLAAQQQAPASATEDEVRVLGQTAIVVGTARFDNGLNARFIQQWTNRGGQWRLVAHEGTAVASSQQGATGTAGTKPTMGKGEPKASPRKSMDPSLTTADEREVWKTMQAIEDAYLAGDTASYSKLTGDDYVRLTEEGAKLNKDEWIATVKKNAGRAQGRIEANDVQIDVDGDVARVLTAEWGTEPGGGEIEPLRGLRIFHKRDGRWQQVAAVLTPIEK